MGTLVPPMLPDPTQALGMLSHSFETQTNKLELLELFKLSP